jgi:hypothetical protein
MKEIHSELLSRRAELMVELFLQELNPAFIAQPSRDIGFDYLVSFPSRRGSSNTFGVAVKATTKHDAPVFAVSKRMYNQLAHSNSSAFLLVADVKQNKLYFGFPPKIDTRKTGSTIDVPLTQINSQTRKDLYKRLTA